MDISTYICAMKNIDNLIGQTFNRLTVLGVSENRNTKYIPNLLVKCSCGTIKEVSVYNVKNGHTKSCGCLHKALLVNQTYTRKYNYNEEFFKELNSNSLYVLGLMYSDGNLSKEKGKGGINLREGDEYLLKTISLLIKNNDKLIYVPSKIGQGIIEGCYSHPQYKFYFCNKNIYKDLLELGLIPNKSKIIKVDDRLKNSLDFWRGVIDGDGSIQIITYPTGTKSLRISLCSASISLINSFKDFCCANSNTKSNITKIKDREFYVFTSTGENAVKLYKLLYDNDGLCLKRKKKYLKNLL